MGKAKNFYKIMSILIAGLFMPALVNAQDYQFQNFKVSPKLSEKYKVQRIQTEPAQGVKKTSKLKDSFPVLEKGSPGLGLGDVSSFESPLMQEIRDYLGGNFSAIRDEQRMLLFQRGRQYNLGVKNYSGFMWQKPMGEYTIYADRQVVPSMSDDRWVASDQLVIAINAQTFLQSLADNGDIEIGSVNFGAFAGLEFRRVYEYKYFVNSYEGGLNGNFDRLLLSFAIFNDPNPNKMRSSEIAKKTDYFGFHAGAVAGVPLQYGFGLSAGVLVKSEKLSEVEIQTLSENDILATGELMKIRSKQEKTKRLGAELSLTLDFFHLLKLTLLSFEYEKVKTESKTTHLSFNVSDIEQFNSGTEVSKALNDLLNFREFNSALYPYLDKKQETLTESSKKTFRFFNNGSADKKESSISEFDDRTNNKKVFIDHNTKYIKYKKGWKDAVYSMAFQSALGFDLWSNYKWSRKKTSDLEYEKEDNTRNYDVNIGQEFFAYKTHTKKVKSYKKKALIFLNDFTYFPDEIIALVESDQIRGPLKIKVVGKVKPEAVFYLDSFNKKEIQTLIEGFCGGIDNGRQNAFKAPSSSTQNKCYRKIYKEYKDYKKTSGKSIEKRLWAIKDLITQINLQGVTLKGIEELFGSGGIYFTGTLEAMTNKGQDFKTNFEQGDIQSLGPMNNYLNWGHDPIPATYLLN